VEEPPQGPPGDSPAAALVGYRVADGIAVLTLDSRHNRNALSRRLVAELLDGLAAAEADEAVRVVVLRAEGPVFCSGADLAEAAGGSMRDGAAALVEVQRRIVALSKPVVARVHGPVRAGGTGIVAACDLAVAAESATFALTEVRLALAPAVVSLTVLPRLTSRTAARVVLTGEPFDGAAAAAMGLVTVAVPVDELDGEVDRLVTALVAGHPQGLRESKRLLNAGLLTSIERDGEALADLSQRLFASEEARGAMAAFLTRRR
jgi:methylglutaconyl-CoA hydratase